MKRKVAGKKAPTEASRPTNADTRNPQNILLSAFGIMMVAIDFLIASIEKGRQLLKHYVLPISFIDVLLLKDVR